LYGAPGTGKTLLAGVIAKEYALNFICIKVRCILLYEMQANTIYWLMCIFLN